MTYFLDPSKTATCSSSETTVGEFAGNFIAGQILRVNLDLARFYRLIDMTVPDHYLHRRLRCSGRRMKATSPAALRIKLRLSLDSLAAVHIPIQLSSANGFMSSRSISSVDLSVWIQCL